jgi:hypothetical protein
MLLTPESTGFIVGLVNKPIELSHNKLRSPPLFIQKVEPLEPNLCIGPFYNATESDLTDSVD